MNALFNTIDLVLCIGVCIQVVYLWFFTLHAQTRPGTFYPDTRNRHRFLILFPAYKEDLVIDASIRSFLQQEYPKEFYQVVVISDQMKESTNLKLMGLPIKLIIARFENSSKAAAINLAMSHTQEKEYDCVVIMDADNTVEPDFLNKLNNAYDFGIMAMQSHRKAKNKNTDVAILDAASEEINNSIFRKGHIHAGLSSALSGSGMAFDFEWFRKNVKNITTAGEDKELELILLRQNIYIDYLENTPVYDEKTQRSTAFFNQRRRWVAAQFSLFFRGIKYLPKAILNGNVDYCDKLLQWIFPPRIILTGVIFFMALSTTLIAPDLASKWWITLIFLLICYRLAVPDDLVNKHFMRALIKLPFLFLLMVINMFRIWRVNSNFIHTKHGE